MYRAGIDDFTLDALQQYLEEDGEQNDVYKILSGELFAFQKVSLDQAVATSKTKCFRDEGALGRCGEGDAEMEMLFTQSHIILRGHVDDAHLLDVRVDMEKMTIAFDWKTLSSLLLAVEKICDKLDGQMVNHPGDVYQKHS